MINELSNMYAKKALTMLNDALDTRASDDFRKVQNAIHELENHDHLCWSNNEVTNKSIKHLIHLLESVIEINTFPIEIRFGIIEIAAVRLDHMIYK